MESPEGSPIFWCALPRQAEPGPCINYLRPRSTAASCRNRGIPSTIKALCPNSASRTLLLFIVFGSLLPKIGAIARSGVKDFRFHDTRHTAATRVLRESNLRVVQTLLGHSDVKTTTKYPHAIDGRRAQRTGGGNPNDGRREGRTARENKTRIRVGLRVRLLSQNAEKQGR